VTPGEGKPRGAARGREHAPSATHARQTDRPLEFPLPLGSITTRAVERSSTVTGAGEQREKRRGAPHPRGAPPAGAARHAALCT
jgi:hypothetical protein